MAKKRKIERLTNTLERLNREHTKLSTKLLNAIKDGINNSGIMAISMQRNNIYTDIVLTRKKIENIDQGLPELGREIIDYNIRL